MADLLNIEPWWRFGAAILVGGLIVLALIGAGVLLSIFFRRAVKEAA